MFSNIIGKSNVYVCKGKQNTDQRFVDNVFDYKLLSEIYKNNYNYGNNLKFSEKQKKIVEMNIRCNLAKNDPCWGYIDEQGVVCKCINKNCVHIERCNSRLTDEEVHNWTMTIEEKEKYGEPRGLRKYYLVDLVSKADEELYSSHPEYVGKRYKPIMECENKEIKYEKIVIGYTRQRFNDYEDEQISPIYGDVLIGDEDVVEKLRPRYGSAYSYRIKKWRNTSLVEDDQEGSWKLEESVTSQKEKNKSESFRDHIYLKSNEKIKLEDILSDKVEFVRNKKKVVMIFGNPAELSYVSSMLLKCNKHHSVSVDESQEGNILLCLSDNMRYEKSYEVVLFSQNAFKSMTEDNEAWVDICRYNNIKELILQSREYYYFLDETERKRWCCGNHYGATHICVESDDLMVSPNFEFEYCEVILRKEDNDYLIYDVLTEQSLGKANLKFVDILNKLQQKGEIPDLPDYISGVSIKKKQKKVSVMGIGHMHFSVY